MQLYYYDNVHKTLTKFSPPISTLNKDAVEQALQQLGIYNTLNALSTQIQEIKETFEFATHDDIDKILE